MALVTILTPTYNRAEYLPRLYESILRQDSNNWVWMIVDDGSSDGTRELVQTWVEEQGERIRYIHKPNGGKHTALNVGIAQVTTSLTFIVDSDDTLMPNAVSTIEEYDSIYSAERERLHIGGFSFLRVFSDGSVNGGEYPQDNVIGNCVDVRVNTGDTGDKAEVYYADVLQRYPFPVFQEERFLPEDAVWMKMAEEYSLVHANRKVYCCDYHEGGLTQTGRAMKIYSPLGMMYRSAVYLTGDFARNHKVALKMIMLYQIYRRFAARKYDLHTTTEFTVQGIPAVQENTFSWLLQPITWLIYHKWASQYRESN